MPPAMDALEKTLNAFIAYVRRLSGDEKGEAQVFLDRFFQGFGYAGYKEAGDELAQAANSGNLRDVTANYVQPHVKAVCDCGNIVRMSCSTLAKGQVGCRGCGKVFVEAK